MSKDARNRERLYQHDIGITRLRQTLARRAKAAIAAEDRAAEDRAAENRMVPKQHDVGAADVA
jgi:hypothetical protein